MKKIFTLISFSFFLLAAALAQGPEIRSVYPSNALPADTITITGTNFTEGMIVRFNTWDATEVNILSATMMKVTVPEHLSQGKYGLEILSYAGTAKGSIFINNPPTPVITSFSPGSGLPGSTVTITGSGFSSTFEVIIGGERLSDNQFTVLSPTSVKATIPYSSQTGKIILGSAGGQVTSAADFTVLPAAAPVITSFSPVSAISGSSITITGNNFISVGSIEFNEVMVTDFTINSATSITAKVPLVPAEMANMASGKIKIYSPGGIAMSQGDFTVTLPPAPVVTGISPSSAKVGAEVTITGSGFLTAYEIQINGVPIMNPFKVNSSGSITFSAPFESVTGKLSVLTSGGIAESSTNFSTILPAPAVVTSFSPVSGEVGSLVTISGDNLMSSLITEVKFNAQSCEIISWGENALVVMIPAPGTGKFTVTSMGGTSESLAEYTAVMPEPPVISSFSPVSGVYNSLVTISGSNLSSVKSIFFADGVQATDFTVNSPSSVTLRVPPAAASGYLFLETIGGVVQSLSKFVVDAEGAPTISSFTPESNPVGTTITITGTNLASTFYVGFNGVYTMDFVVNSSTSLTVKVPAGASSGKIEIFKFKSAVLSTEDFTVEPTLAPSLGSFSPSGGTAGTPVTVTGANLSATYYIMFNGIEVSEFKVNSATSVSFNVPAGAQTGKISIVTAGGTAVSNSNFNVTQPVPPTVISFTPAGNYAGTLVTITGKDFTGATSVKFNNTPAISFTVNSATSITTKVPSGATTGKISVVTPAGTAVSSSDFTVNIPTGSVGYMANAELVKDFNSADLDIDQLIPAGNKLLMLARKNSSTTEMWATDASGTNTVLLTDILAGRDIQRGYSGFHGVKGLSGNYYLSLTRRTGSESESEPFITDGTPGGTMQLADLNPNTTGVRSSLAHTFIEFDGAVLFMANNGSGEKLFRHNGSGSPVVVSGITAVYDYITVNNELWIAGSNGSAKGLFKMSGSASAPVLVSSFYNIQYGMQAIGDKVLFWGQKSSGDSYGKELYITDGTDAGTLLLKDISEGNNSPYVEDLNISFRGTTRNYEPPFAVLDKVAYFAVRDNISSLSYVYRTDGTPSGTFPVFNNTYNITDVLSIKNNIVFSAFDASDNRRKNYTTDGTSAPEPISNAESSYFDFRTSYEGGFCFDTEGNFLKTATDLLISDGTNEGTKTVKVYYAGTRLNLGMDDLTVIGSSLFFKHDGNVYKVDLNNMQVVSGINESNENSAIVSLFPNPNSGIFTAEVASPDFKEAQLTVHNELGKAVLQSAMAGPEIQIDLRDQPEGIYIVRIKSGESVWVGKVVVQ